MRKNSKKQTPVLTLVVLLIALVSAVVVKTTGGESETQAKSASSASAIEDGLSVHYLDVGQGDSEFIELPNGECMLIDAAESGYSYQIISTIEDLGYSEINYLVATHPHSDHIGGMADVVNSFDIGEIYMPNAVTDTATYENLLTVISDKNYSINTAKAGEVIYSDSECEIEILAPVSEEYSNLNNYSVVVKITYGVNSFLFTGDAEVLVEEEIMSDNYLELDCDVLKVSHHGSNSSSSDEFIGAVSPEYAVISVGAGNSYGHPNEEILQKLVDIGAEVFRTDSDGTVTITCDGNDNFEVQTENELDN